MVVGEDYQLGRAAKFLLAKMAGVERPLSRVEFDVAACATDTRQFCPNKQIQLHGQVGFTWAHHTRLDSKWTRFSASWLTSPSAHRKMIAARLFGEAA